LRQAARDPSYQESPKALYQGRSVGYNLLRFSNDVKHDLIKGPFQPALVKYVDSLKLVLFNQLVTATFIPSRNRSGSTSTYTRFIMNGQHRFWSLAITSIYCHPIEHAFSNLSPVLIGPVICGSHVTTIWIWACVAVMSTTFSHSGYHFPLQPSPEAHDYHHKVYVSFTFPMKAAKTSHQSKI
uniref:Fatty acid hydroxylase domain-containing protein n=1 Tax=Heligmosomoides polygyrus TaxID=6339 RepID=A0A183F1Y7_HELPZ